MIVQMVPIEDEYVIGKELGRGRFSVVRSINKQDHQHASPFHTLLTILRPTSKLNNKRHINKSLLQSFDDPPPFLPALPRHVGPIYQCMVNNCANMSKS